MKALIFHGTHGSPQGNWFQWLQDHLMITGWQVAVPALPTPEDQSLENWKKALKQQVPGFQDAEILVGHSCGGSFSLRLIEEGLVKPEKAIFVSTVIDALGNQFDELNKSFVDRPFEWDKIKENCSEAIVFHGDNDPYVSITQAETISKALDAPLNIIKDGGHISAESGYFEFCEILDVLDV